MSGIFSWLRAKVREAFVAGVRDAIDDIGGLPDAEGHADQNAAFLITVRRAPVDPLEGLPALNGARHKGRAGAKP